MDSQGNLFIADTGNDAVREVSPTGTITTIAGELTQEGSTGDGGQATSALLSSPLSVALDGQANLFIADSDNNRIREVNLNTGVITSVTGTGAVGSTGDNGAAASARLNQPDRRGGGQPGQRLHRRL